MLISNGIGMANHDYVVHPNVIDIRTLECKLCEEVLM